METKVSEWGEDEEARHRRTVEGLADVDTGQVIDHQAVQTWTDSLDTKKPLPKPDVLRNGEK